MESLYVCLFSNGHIKVGRSIDPNSRIASHADRVACVGISLEQSYITECPNQCEAREQVLIRQCAAAATGRPQTEWFAGLSFNDVCSWAYEAAHEYDVPERPSSETRWSAVIAELKKLGWSQTSLAALCGCGASTVSRLALGQQDEPLHSMGETLLDLLRNKTRPA